MKNIKKQRIELARLRADKSQDFQTYKAKSQQKSAKIDELNDVYQISLSKKERKKEKKLAKRLKKYVKGYDKNNLVMLKDAGLKIQGKIDYASFRTRVFVLGQDNNAGVNAIEYESINNKQKAILQVRRDLSLDLKKAIEKLEIINAKLIYSLSPTQLKQFVRFNHITTRS